MARKPLGKRILANFGKKWVQVIIAFLVLTLVLFAAHRVFVPKPKGEKEAKAGFKYMHCSKCNVELTYNEEMANKRSMGCKCKSDVVDVGVWEPTEKSLKDGGGDGEGKVPFYTTVLVGTTLFMAVLWYLLARKDLTPTHFHLSCLHCKEVLRYTKDGFDKLVECPTCEQPIRLPSEEEALSREDMQEETTEHYIGAYETQLRSKGYLPGEEQPAEEQPDATDPNATGHPDTPR